jgi:outer membrane cobalamin receptor
MTQVLFRYVFGILLMAACTNSAWAQLTVINGYAIDMATGEGLSYASIKLNGTAAAVADSMGYFKLSISEPGAQRIDISKAGYRPYTRRINIGEDERVKVIFELEPISNELNRVVISASRQKKQLARETVSITSVQPYLVSNTNSNTLSDVLNRVPGISVVEGQAIIRGAVGWSYNVGSRVMVLLDDMPMMGADVGDVQWDLLPIEAAENIEVIKGPSSVLYGSSASSGTISVQTGWPTNKPQTRIQIYQGITDNPQRRETVWWERTSQPFNNGIFASHKQKFGNFDLVWSGNVDANSSYLEQNDQFRARTYVKTRYRFKSIPGLTAGLGGTLLFKKGGRYFLWQDADTNILRAFAGSTGEDFYRIWSFDPYITYSKAKYSLSVRARHYNITRFVDTVAFPNANDAVATIQALDINFRRNWFKGFSTISGIYTTRMWSVGNVYPGEFTGYTAAAFTQAEYEIGRFTTNAGIRYEINALGPIEESPGPLLRAGINYKAGKKTYLRATYGEGFRFATVAERFVDDRVSGLAILPNPNLRSETGWYTEFGLKQGFNIGKFNASVDYAFFWQEYRDLIEFRFQQWRRDSSYINFDVNPPQFVVVPGVIGFRASNFDLTRTAGMEWSLETDGHLGNIGIRSLCGYTYTFPIDLNRDSSLQAPMAYMREFFGAISGLDERQMNTLLPYRNRHLVKIDIELSYKKLMLGYGSFYYSRFDKIDIPLYTLIPGMRDYMARVGSGDWVHNFRLGYAASHQVTVALLLNNTFNREYAIRPARIDQPRNINLQVRIAL